ncbi:phosphoglucomutase (alpha-D-glucose-1,6-bisphosphate-dependent) [Nitrincola sp. MINF-07-Sa-05]|uniref:phosphoglucomutase (alpha-D-glucose-1,6-bisphosphate-dependent) n=1 Tax=Nitrincola salilacus TaxID=3400273 RepID=UPI003917C75E
MIETLLRAYTNRPDNADPAQRVSFGTSGHRGSSLAGSFNDAHIAAIVQAVVDYRCEAGITGPLFLGRDTHALSRPAWDTAMEVLAGNGVEVVIAKEDEVLATPVISHAILRHNASLKAQSDAPLADGLIITPSHNPPEDGGIKYNPPHGGPAEANITASLEAQANRYLDDGGATIQRLPLEQARALVREQDLIGHYVDTLGDVIDMAAIQSQQQRSGLRLGVDPMGGTALPIWQTIAKRYGLALDIINPQVDANFAFMPPDHDGKIRMDCSSSAAMANLLAIKDRFDLAFGNDPDADRHGIVDAGGLMNPNHYLAVAIDYLLGHRPLWGQSLKLGKTLVSSSMIDRVVAAHGCELYEVPVGFKWFVEGLHQSWLAFGGEESAGASLLTFDAMPWSTDKDGIALCLLAAEIMAVTGQSPSQRYAELTARHGAPVYRRIDSPCDAQQKAAFKQLSADSVVASTLAGDPITQIMTKAPGNNESIGGLKVTTAHGWFAARPSGTEALYKLYAESFRGEAHLEAILDEARQLLAVALAVV